LTPAFYDPDRVGTLFYPDIARIAGDARAAALAPADDDRVKVHLLIVDMQIDFCHEQGALFVPGALDDIKRLIAFIYRHADRITDITCSLDSHLPHQIFHASWWVSPDGRHPEPFTLITPEDVAGGHWQPVRDREWSIRYVQRLRERAKKALTIWPYHVPIGGLGNALDPELWSAVFWHALARGSQPNLWTKGSIPQTEHYSILQPEIAVPGNPQSRKSRAFLDMLRSRDHILIAGEASSHCVLETVEDLVEEFSEGGLRRTYILRDCTSPVRHPVIDFEEVTRQQFLRFEQMGVRFISSTDPLPF
jgi:nicotinamidase-related amidase